MSRDEPVPSAATLAGAACLGMWPAPWTVRPHPDPRGRQCPWLWRCDHAGCDRGGQGVSDIDAHQQAAEHHLKQHN